MLRLDGRRGTAAIVDALASEGGKVGRQTLALFPPEIFWKEPCTLVADLSHLS